MDISGFYTTLSPLEKAYWAQLEALFKRVDARKPEKGIIALIFRARALADQQNIPLEQALADTLEGATQRTERRIALLQQCAMKSDSAF
ncbi:hypothetical protein [Vampirovibrio chlorellavorus]|uniref:hypothetical protein n=1 Tax=Vampirovibrio chlorellavorus TaxID=758823 RepID=UPI0026EE06E3|nr:hypothetical protein [Vampirovibrio chlorellavorus]